jgi:hypothetical protein
MGETLRRDAGGCGEGRTPDVIALIAKPRRVALVFAINFLSITGLACGLPVTWIPAFAGLTAAAAAQEREPAAPVRMDSGRFTFVCYPSDSTLARSLLIGAMASDSFPGMPRPSEHVLVAIAPDSKRFREWIGPNAPEWGAAVAFPSQNRIILQGSGAGSDAGDHRIVLRHELAHLALDEYLGDLPPRWFDEGYASLVASEWSREAALAANFTLIFRGVPSLDSLDGGFFSSATTVQATYALAHVAVAELAALDRERGLALFFNYWRESRSLERAVRSAYGVTLSGFESRWKRSVMLRYGIIAIVADVSLFAIVVMVLLLPLYIRRRKRQRDRLQKMKVAESAAERRAVTEALTEMLGEPRDGPTGTGGGAETRQ